MDKLNGFGPQASGFKPEAGAGAGIMTTSLQIEPRGCLSLMLCVCHPPLFFKRDLSSSRGMQAYSACAALFKLIMEPA